MIRNRAMDNQTYSSSVIPFGYVGVKKEEKVVFPDDTVYFLSAFWMAVTFQMFLTCSYTILAVIRKVLLSKTMDLFLFFRLGLYGPGCTTCGVGVSDISKTFLRIIMNIVFLNYYY
jgi:hypothetical protein